MSDAAGKPEAGEVNYEIAHLRLVPKRHIGRIVAAIVVLVLLAALVRALVYAQIEWNCVGRFLFAPVIISGIYNTIIMTIVAMVVGIVFGVVTAIMRISGNPVLSSIAVGYVWIFRGAPALVQLLLWFNLALVFPTMGIPGLFEFRTVDVMTPFVAAMLGLGIQQGAYTSEVVAVRASLGRQRPVRGGTGDRHDADADAAADRAAAGDARHRSADRQRGDQHGQADLAGAASSSIRKSCTTRRSSTARTRGCSSSCWWRASGTSSSSPCSPSASTTSSVTSGGASRPGSATA